MNSCLYETLNLPINSSIQDVKNQFRKLALKYHPDKNSSTESTEQFQQIHLAYTVLSDPIQKEKYDAMNTSNKKTMMDKFDDILSFIKNKHKISDLQAKICSTKEGRRAIELGGESLRNYIINYILKMITDDISDFVDQNEVPEHNSSNDSCETVLSSDTDMSTSGTSLYVDVTATIKEIYNNKQKEIEYSRQRYGSNNRIFYEQCSVIIPLIHDKITVENKGHEVISTNAEPTNGKLIIKILTKKDRDFKRVNDHDLIYCFSFSLYELFNGITRSITLPNDDVISLVSINAFNESFDGTKFIKRFESLGLPCNIEGTSRGCLFVKFTLNKSENFNDLIKKI